MEYNGVVFLFRHLSGAAIDCTFLLLAQDDEPTATNADRAFAVLASAESTLSTLGFGDVTNPRRVDEDALTRNCDRRPLWGLSKARIPRPPRGFSRVTPGRRLTFFL